MKNVKTYMLIYNIIFIQFVELYVIFFIELATANSHIKDRGK